MSLLLHARVQSLPATNYQGMQNGSPNPNEPYTTQSVPNTNYGDRMLNNAAMANNNQYQNQLHQANGYNQQHMENIMPAQNQMIGQNQFPMNYQHYNTSTQPTANGIIQNLDNQQSAPHPNNAAVSAHNTYSVQGQYLTPTQVHSLQNNANQMATHTATGVYNQAQNAHGSQDEVPNMTYQNDQQALHQNKLEPQPPANWSTPNVAYSQPAINAQTYAMTPQYQNVNQMNANTVPQSFANLNNQFSNMDNQAPNQQYGLNNAVVTPQPSFSNIQGASGQMVNMPSVNTGATNAQHSENSNMIHTSQTMVPNNYIQPQAYVNNNNNMQSQNQWSQQNYQNIPQYQNANLDIRTNIPTNYNNVLHAGMIPSNQNLNPNAPQISQLQTLTNNQSRQPIDTSSVPQNIPAAEPHIHLNQPSQQLVTGNHEASASIQQLPSLNQQNDNMKRIVSSPTISVPYGHHTNQTYIQSVPNIPQQLVQPTYQNYNTNPITNQAYNSQNQNMATKIASNHNQHVPQASYSARNVTNSAEMQISQHNVPINHSVPNVPNMSHGDFIQPNLPNVNAVPEKNRNNDLNNVKQTEEVNRNHGKGDAKAMEEEGSLPYGYPPQLHSVNIAVFCTGYQIV
ncbi:hypothetical protein NQ317_009173 [Molorchus minor]|uniref:Uncharacterized protein n=1 Tax=Molorchus minor TaxID=1323400 RepID=A0ABQ9J4W8_9CUCU|nr:hypothetical protein NQ317_009173 [Molorchus minor]